MVAPENSLDEAQSPLRVGEILVGKYRVERQIGRGGMGIVLAATHLQLEHLVAIKVLRRDLLEDDKALQRLFLEARAAAKIRSQHVARVLDVGTLESGSPFIVMEYLDGEDLADLLDRQGALEVPQAVQFLLQSCEALAEVHAAEMVHRDLKPGNLFVAKLPDGSPSLKIVDFGISKHIGSTSHQQAATTSSQVLGSPYYMPPEQMRAEPVDERSDIWSLGAILFEMLTGRPPFLGDTLPEVYAGVLSGSAPSMESLRPGIPAALDDIVHRCLDKDPAQRFCDVADLAEALAPFGPPASTQSVERITRILTNPELYRGRGSSAPRAPLSAEQPQAAGTARGGIAIDPRLAITPGRITPSPVVSAGAPSPLGAPLLAAPGPRAGTPSELGPLSATGPLEALEPELGRPGRGRVWWALGALVLAVGGGLWFLQREVAPLGHPAVVSLPPPGPLTAAESAPAAPAQEQPVAKGTPTEPTVAPAPPAIQTERRALEPAGARPPGVSVEAVRSAITKRSSKEERASETRSKSRPAPTRAVAAPASAPPRNETSRAAAPSAPAAAAASAPAASAPAASAPAASSGRSSNAAREEDPWNPSSFGDRH